MKQVIYKYPVLTDATIELPGKYEILCCNVQEARPFIWCQVNPDDVPYTQQFLLVPTGSPQNLDGWMYIGSFHGVAGWMVLHLFKKEGNQ